MLRVIYDMICGWKYRYQSFFEDCSEEGKESVIIDLFEISYERTIKRKRVGYFYNVIYIR